MKTIEKSNSKSKNSIQKNSDDSEELCDNLSEKENEELSQDKKIKFKNATKNQMDLSPEEIYELIPKTKLKALYRAKTADGSIQKKPQSEAQRLATERLIENNKKRAEERHKKFNEELKKAEEKKGKITLPVPRCRENSKIVERMKNGELGRKPTIKKDKKTEVRKQNNYPSESETDLPTEDTEHEMRPQKILKKVKKIREDLSEKIKNTNLAEVGGKTDTKEDPLRDYIYKMMGATKKN